MLGLRGEPLEQRDYEALEARWIDKETADRSKLRRVDTSAGGDLVGRNGSGRYEGLAIPNVWPGEEGVREYRLRRDHPEFENGKPKQKYMAPPGRGNLLYFPIGTQPEWLQDPTLPISIVEGEFKSIALFRAANHGLGDAAERPRLLPIGISGIWGWRGTTGKTTDETGARVDEKGPIPDLARIKWTGRTVTIVFDRDAETNEKVGIARSMLARELRSRGAVVKCFAWPNHSHSAKGIDDLLAMADPDEVLRLIAEAPEAGLQKAAEPRIQSIAELPSMRTFAAKKIEFAVEGIIAAGAVTAITGDAGSGKSTFVTALCGAVRNGERFAGLPTQQRPVLMLDRDNPLPSVIERFARLQIEDGPDFTVWGGWHEEDAPSPCSLIVTDYIQASKPSPLVVVDCLAAFLEGDENDAGAVRAFMQGLRRLTHLGASVVILHHSGKGDSTRDYRGSSDFKASIDVGYLLTNLGDPARLSRVRLKAFKSRFIVDSDMVFSYNDGRFYLDDRPVARTNAELAKELLIANPGVTKADFEKLAVEKNISRSHARGFIESSVVSRLIRVDRVGNAQYHTWVGDPELGRLC